MAAMASPELIRSLDLLGLLHRCRCQGKQFPGFPGQETGPEVAELGQKLASENKPVAGGDLAYYTRNLLEHPHHIV